MTILATGAASAAPAPHPASVSGHSVHNPNGFQPGGLIKKRPGAQVKRKGKYYQAQSSNWSGYAVTGNDGAFNSVSSSWTEPNFASTGRPTP